MNEVVFLPDSEIDREREEGDSWNLHGMCATDVLRYICTTDYLPKLPVFLYFCDESDTNFSEILFHVGLNINVCFTAYLERRQHPSSILSLSF